MQLPTTPDGRTPSPLHSSKFDLNLARISVVLDIIAFLTMLFASNGSLFACGAALQALGSGYSPALQAFALEVYSRRGGKGEAGRLFGALSVVQGLG